MIIECIIYFCDRQSLPLFAHRVTFVQCADVLNVDHVAISVFPSKLKVHNIAFRFL